MTVETMKSARDTRIRRAAAQERRGAPKAVRNWQAAARWDRVLLRALAIAEAA